MASLTLSSSSPLPRRAAMSDDRMSLVSPVGYSSSTCGYCTPPGSGRRSSKKSSKSYGIWANDMTPETYQQLLDRGWRRSGHYIYRPDNGYKGTCCPQHAFRLHADTFKPSRSHKAAMAALKAFVRQTKASSSSASSHTLQDCHPGKGKYSRPWDVEREWDLVQWDTNDESMEESRVEAEESESETTEAKKAQEKQRHIDRSRAGAEERAQRRAARQRGEKDQRWWTDLQPFRSGPKRRRFTTSLALATSTEEKYQLFRRYQMQVHGESEAKVSTMQGFERFLCKSPVRITMPSYNSDESTNGRKPYGREGRQAEKVVLESTDPIAYGLYHMEYRLDDELIAVGVLDVLPRCLSSVYLFYEPNYGELQLGKTSALREIALVRQLSRKRGMQSLTYYNLGLYIHSCPKMRYKAQYQPAEILDSKTCEWTPYDVAKPLLDAGVRHSFSSSNAVLEGQVKDNGAEAIKVDANGIVGIQSEKDVGDHDDDDDDHKHDHNEDEDEDEDDDDDDDDDGDDDDGEIPDPPPPGIAPRNETERRLPILSMRTLILDLEAGHKVCLLAQSSVAQDPTKLHGIIDCLSALNDVAYRFVLYVV